MSRAEHLITVQGLQVADPAPVVLDVRWRLGEEPGAGRRAYAAGHLPGAHFLDFEAVLTAHGEDPRDGRHPLPDAATLERGLDGVGVRADTEVVVYDEPGSYAASRAWWVLRWAGIRARVLDGGLPAWVASGAPLETGDPAADAAPGSAHEESGWLTTGHLPTLTADEAADQPAHGVLIDVRAPERYRGEVEPLDPKAGHIPGAVNVYVGTLFTDAGTLPTEDVLAAGLGELTRAGDVAAYCGSGVSATQNVLALAVLDVSAALFPGSWSAWSNDPQRPVATGPEPG